MIGSADLKLMADDTAQAYRRAGFEVHTMPFHYSFPLSPFITNMGLPDQPVRTETDRDSVFVWLATSVHYFDMDHPGLNTAAWFAGFSLQVTDEGSGYRVLGPDRVLPHQALTGVDGAPFVLGFPYVFTPGSRITATLRGSGETGFAHLGMIGVKLFTDPYTRRAILPDVPGLEAA